MTAVERLADLEAQVRRELELTAYPRPEWVIPRAAGDEQVVDVLIVGGGQAGLSMAFALKRRAITNTLILDAAPAGEEGPWITYAAMHTLRTPKALTGPDQGVPALTPEAWYRAAHGDAAWEALTHIPKEHWQDYLIWFRKVTAPRMVNDTSVESIEPEGELLRVRHSAGSTLARRIVLATGLAGNGEWGVPSIIADNVPADRYIHTGAQVDFSRFAGQRIGVLGGGASAFDYAASALEQGAASADVFYRRAAVPRVNPFRWMEFYGFGAHFPDLPDDDKWRFTVQFQRVNQPPPQQTWYRCTRFDQFHWHTSADWHQVTWTGEQIEVNTGAGTFTFDAIISGTGPTVDFSVRPELRALEPLVATWADRYEPEPDWAEPGLLTYPYLDRDFGFTEKVPGQAPWVGRIHDFTYGARLSMGLNGNMNSGLGAGVRRLAEALSRSLFLEDREAFFASYQDYDVPELVDLGRPVPTTETSVAL